MFDAEPERGGDRRAVHVARGERYRFGIARRPRGEQDTEVIRVVPLRRLDRVRVDVVDRCDGLRARIVHGEHRDPSPPSHSSTAPSAAPSVGSAHHRVEVGPFGALGELPL